MMNFLEQAKAIYDSHAGQHRDKMLEVGRLLSRFVKASIGDGKERWLIIREMVDSMGVSSQYLRQIIVSAAAVDLLGNGQDLGKICHGSLRHFDLFIRRDGLRHGRNACEEWAVKPEYAVKAKALFAQAVREKWSEMKTRREVKKVFKCPFKSGRKAKPAEGTFASQFKESLAKASPGDVAEACMSMLASCENPERAIACLESRIEKYLARKKAI